MIDEISSGSSVRAPGMINGVPQVASLVVLVLCLFRPMLLRVGTADHVLGEAEPTGVEGPVVEVRAVSMSGDVKIVRA